MTDDPRPGRFDEEQARADRREIVAILRQRLSEQGADRWLNSAARDLGGEAPESLLRQGRVDEVRVAAERLARGRQA